MSPFRQTSVAVPHIKFGDISVGSSITIIKVAQKQLCLDDDVYRAKLQAITGKTSAKDMTEDERQRVIENFRRLGFRPAARRPDGRQKLTGKYRPKLQALWIAAYNLGIARERDDTALLAFVKRQTGIDHTRFLHDAGDARRVIEALKGWMEREGGVDWSVSKFTAEWEKAEGFRIARAQWAILVGPAKTIDRAFWNAVVGILGQHVAGRELTAEEWIPVMNTFGERIRRQKAA